MPQVLAEHVTLKGEIIDPKCYLGAMKPGGGKTHKACAMLCISGGVPPMLVTRDANKQETFYLLTTDQGGVANELVLPFVGATWSRSSASWKSTAIYSSSKSFAAA